MSIAGDWYNEFGSHMHLTEDPSGGLTGTYVSGAGDAPGSYPLTGRRGVPAGSGVGTALGWTVAWQNEQGGAGSVTGWSGQYLPDRETISATWLLTRPSVAEGVWESTVIGQDVFRRTPFDADEVARHTGSGRPHSHPQTPAA
jgi:hypothetical protein